jgi:hypothetical protein
VRRFALPAVVAAAGLMGVAASWLGAPVFPFGICAYLVLSLVPGAALYRLAARDTEILEEITAAIVLSPVLTAAAAALLMLAGAGTRETAALVVVLSSGFGVAALLRPRSFSSSVDRRQGLALALFLAVLSGLVFYLPATSEWWRVRSDGWFHGAVIAQIADYGIPPEDPYAVGFPLQYMWIFHVFAFVLAGASGVDPFMAMAVVNVFSLVGLALAGFLFSSVFRKAFSHNFAALLTLVFGMNAAVWLFLPVKFLQAFSGDVRGWEEVARVFSLRPYDALSVRGFVQLGFIQEWLLDKFMVATAFTVGLALMAALWWAAARYLATEKRQYLFAAFVSAFGVVAYHTALGMVVFGSVAGGLFVMLAFGRRWRKCAKRPILRLLGAMVLAGVLLLPYMYSITYAKTGEAAFPLGLSFLKMLGIAVSCALVIFLSAFQWRRVLGDKTPAALFLVWTTAAVVFLCAIVRLPAANAYDKFPFLLFFPLAVLGGWTIAEYAERAAAAGRRTLRYVAACLLAFGPLNIFMFAGYYNTVPVPIVSEDEKKVGKWISAATPRESVVIDTNLNCFLLIEGPRRYYMASELYAFGWGYDQSEIGKRVRVIADLYAPGELDRDTLETVGALRFPLFILVRSGEPSVDETKFGANPELFHRVFAAGPITVYEIDRPACLSAAGEPDRTG